MSKNKVKEKENKEIKRKKKKMSVVERNKLFMKIATWFTVLIMVVGLLITLFSPLLFS